MQFLAVYPPGQPLRAGDVQLHVTKPRRQLPLAVPDPVRRRIHRRQQRPHADSRLHDGRNGRGVLMATTEAPPTQSPRNEPNHGWRMFSIWFVLALAAALVTCFVWKPHLPPGDMSDAARHQQFDIAVLAVTGAPVFIFVLLYFIYSIVVWRARPGDDT